MTTLFRQHASLVLCLSLAAGGSWADSVEVEASRLNVRKAPDAASAVVTTVSRGERLEVLERTGEWFHIKTAGGTEGYVSSRLVRGAAPAPAAPVSARPSAPAGSDAAAPPASTAAAPPWTGERPAIAHRDVSCVLAGEFPRIEACFTPAESVGRAQVQFRADEKGPWYYVNMKPEGACHTALLPKPKKGIGSFHYFIEVVDRSFAAVQKPDAAPGDSYAPRVVTKKMECGMAMNMATSSPVGSVIMGVARNAAGQVLQAAAAQNAELTATLGGFSTDGVTMAGTGAAPGSAAGSTSSTAQSAGGIGTKTLVIAGGAVAAAGVVAIAVNGGSDSNSGSGGSSGGGGSGGGGTNPGGGTTPTNVLTGRWVGNSANGGGITGMFGVEGVSCSYSWDITTDLVQSGTTLTGSGTSVGRGFNCSIPLPPEVAAAIIGQSGSGTLSGTASNGSLSFRVGDLNFTGTYTSTQLNATASMALEGINFTWTWRQTKQ